jgi:hypothetical protein
MRGAMTYKLGVEKKRIERKCYKIENTTEQGYILPGNI